jgi:hypothetical protein
MNEVNNQLFLRRYPMRNVNEILKSMFTEKVAHSMLDSGAHYGYKHDQNEGIDFDSNDTVSFDAPREGETSKDICFTIDAYNYLNGQLTFNEQAEKWNSKIREIRSTCTSDEYPHWTQEVGELLKEWADDENEDITIGEVYNTYNGDSNLSQVLLYSMVQYKDEYYCVLQIHGGCDVRGGYTDAVIFQLDNDYTYDGGYLTPEDVYGAIDGVEVGSSYNGYSLLNDDGEEVPLKFNEDGECISEICLSFYGE